MRPPSLPRPPPRRLLSSSSKHRGPLRKTTRARDSSLAPSRVGGGCRHAVFVGRGVGKGRAGFAAGERDRRSSVPSPCGRGRGTTGRWESSFFQCKGLAVGPCVITSNSGGRGGRVASSSLCSMSGCIYARLADASGWLGISAFEVQKRGLSRDASEHGSCARALRCFTAALRAPRGQPPLPHPILHILLYRYTNAYYPHSPPQKKN